MSRQICPKCTDPCVILCEHVASFTCNECEHDENHVILSGVCFFCLCEGKQEGNFDCKARDVMGRAIDAVKLGKIRRKLGLPAPVLKNVYYGDLYELFMLGYTD